MAGSITPVGDWLDEDGNPKGPGDEDAPAAKANLNKHEKADDAAADDESTEDKVARDKEFNKAVIKAAEDRAAASK